MLCPELEAVACGVKAIKVWNSDKSRRICKLKTIKRANEPLGGEGVKSILASSQTEAPVWMEVSSICCGPQTAASTSWGRLKGIYHKTASDRHVQRISHLLRRKHAPSIGCFDKELTLVIMALLSWYLSVFLPLIPPPLCLPVSVLTGSVSSSAARLQCRYPFL